ncbi:hypothetical protein L873DRAFT_1790942 [Choiromyces venosus 120613-1]|uniref:Uncharacterized protein n=1 Tax=Choiromyces venosus 120613-1 TaxID=1336337 RepID=A0A3N4JJJ4_9PEZI|nr:hypothetical protein L873DRAFT_1790942 [Choiromyces venosus 120613-1]
MDPTIPPRVYLHPYHQENPGDPPTTPPAAPPAALPAAPPTAPLATPPAATMGASADTPRYLPPSQSNTSVTSLPPYTSGGRPPPYISRLNPKGLLWGKPIPFHTLFNISCLVLCISLIIVIELKLSRIWTTFSIIGFTLLVPFSFVIFVAVQTALERRKRGAYARRPNEWS